MSQTHDQRTLRLPAVPPPGAPPGDGEPPGGTPSAARAGRRRRTVALAAGVAVLAAVVGAAGLIHASGSENEYQSVSYAGASPFTTPVGTDQPGLVPLPRGGEQPATSPELYQQDPNRPACDAGALLAQLRTDPVKATAWAQVERITPSALPRYIESLTPVVLRSDTALVDHGYRDGTFVPTPAVLAAGTAVFINSYGQPTVKCYSGDPLAPGTSTDTTVSTVVPAPTPITAQTFHHPVGGTPVTRPGKPDTTGAGPAPRPAPTTADGTGTAPSTAPVTGYFNYDGSIMLSDGRLQKPDGTVVAFPRRDLATTTGLPDGGWRDKYGLYYNVDGSRRDLVPVYSWEEGNVIAFYVTPEGRRLTMDGTDAAPLRPNAGIIRNYDGSITYFEVSNLPYQDLFQTNRSGARGPAPVVYGEREDSRITNRDGRLVNQDGSERKAATLPGGGRIEPNGANVPAPTKPATSPTKAPGTDEPKNSGIVPPKYRTPVHPTTTVPIERGPAKNTGIVPPSRSNDTGSPAASGEPGGSTG